MALVGGPIVGRAYPEAVAQEPVEMSSGGDAIALLAEAASTLHGALDRQGRLEWATEAARSLAGSPFAAFVAVGDGGGVQAVAGLPDVDLHDLRRALADSPVWDEARDVQWVGRATLAVAVPAADGGVHGALLVRRPPADRFDRQVELGVVGIAAHLGVALDNYATFTRLSELEALQREVVHQLQDAVRPPMPTVESTELGVHYLPADESAPTGGDLYDWVVLPDGDLHVVVVDVVGKGVGATKDALGIVHALRMLALDGCPLERIVARTDELVTAQSPDVVATVVVARYRPSDGTVHVAGGGHPPPLVVSADGTVHQVGAPGIAIGWPGAGSSEVTSLTLERSDTLVLYTDGLIESTKDILRGIESLNAAAAETARYPAPHLARALVDRALAGADRRDDSVALVLRRRTPPAGEGRFGLGPFEYRFSPSRATVPLARHLLGDWLEHLPIDEQEMTDLALVASELCTNAVRHASGAPTGLVLRAWTEGDAIVVEVEDDGSGFEAVVDLGGMDELPDVSAERGRGLFLVQALTDELGLHREKGRTQVRALKRAVLTPERT